MKKGINIWSFPAGMPIQDCMVAASDAGFDGIEVALAESGELSLTSSDQEIAGYKQLAADIGIAITSVSSGLGWTFALTSSEQATRERAKEAIKKQVDACVLLGVDTTLVVPGVVGVDFMPSAEVVAYDTAYERALAGLKETAPYAEQAGVVLAVENVWNKFLLSPLEMRDFVDAVGSPAVKVYFDVGNVITTGYPEHWIPILAERIQKVHVKDFRRAVGNINGFVDLLAGDVNYPAVMAALQAIGYDDYIIAEMGTYQHHPLQSIYNTANAMDAILGQGRQPCCCCEGE